jgi:ParB family chromosome partitioning protein
MKAREPLGRGLSAILKDLEAKSSIRLVPVEQISPSPNQPRLDIGQESLSELASSIKEKGLLQPVILRKKGEGYELVAGERRYRASLLAGLKEIPAIIRDVDDREALEIALVENLQREDLNALEVASVYERLVKEFGYTHEELANRIGVDRTSVTNYIRLLKLPEDLKRLIREGKITSSHARTLLSLDDEREQRRYVELITRGRVSVRELERKIKEQRQKTDTFLSLLEERMRQRLGTKVFITYKKEKGKIIIEFFSKEELLRIAEILSGESM